MTFTQDEIDELVARLRPLITAIVQETVAAERRHRRGVTINTGTVLAVDGDTADVAPDDDPNGEIQVTRVGNTHAEGDRVFIVHYPPAGGFILPPIPEPSTSKP